MQTLWFFLKNKFPRPPSSAISNAITMDAPLQASRKGRHHDNSNKHGGEQASSERRRSPSGPQEDFRREQSPEQQQDNHGQHKLSGHPHGGEGARHSQHKQQRRHPKQDHHHHHPKRNIETTKKNDLPEYYVKEQPADENLPNQLTTDPRGDDPRKRITKKASGRGSGRNTESFDPASTLVRPDLRVQVGSARAETFSKVLKHDDVVIVPELFGAEEDWNLYYKLVEEMTVLQTQNVKGAEWIPWHEGAHLIVKKPEASQTFQSILDRLCTYFNIRKESIGYRFNWYKDSSDWKPFHHDSAAFNPQRAKTQNITVGVSFGATRELAFIRAKDNNNNNSNSGDEYHKVRLYFPQTNNGVFSFGRDVNILWKHGINALTPEEQDGKGRISIILWGLAQNVVEEAGSPPLLGSDGHGPHGNGHTNNNPAHPFKRPPHRTRDHGRTNKKR